MGLILEGTTKAVHIYQGILPTLLYYTALDAAWEKHPQYDIVRYAGPFKGHLTGHFDGTEKITREDCMIYHATQA